MYNTSFMKYFFLLIFYCILFVGIYNDLSDTISFGFITALQSLFLVIFIFQLMNDSNINLRSLNINIPKTKYTPEDNIYIPLYLIILPALILQLVSSVFITILANKLKDKYGKIKLTRDNQWFLNIYKVMFIVATFGIFYLTYSYCNDFDNSNQLSSAYITFLLIVLLISTILPICNVINSNKLVKLAYSLTS